VDEIWFTSDPALDSLIQKDFVGDIELYSRNRDALEEVKACAKGHLALTILFDQFPRNSFRKTAQMFQYDPLAREIASEAVQKQLYIDSPPFEAMMGYMPFMHSESITDQIEGCRLFDELVTKCEISYPDNLASITYARDFMYLHRKNIEQFGRFPGRNAALGRSNTAEEEEFMKSGGNTFGG